MLIKICYKLNIVTICCIFAGMADYSAVRVSGESMDKLYRLSNHLGQLSIKPIADQAIDEMYNRHASKMNPATKTLTWKQYKQNNKR